MTGIKAVCLMVEKKAAAISIATALALGYRHMPLCFLGRQAHPKSSRQPFMIPAFYLDTGPTHKDDTPTVNYNCPMNYALLSHPRKLPEHDIYMD